MIASHIRSSKENGFTIVELLIVIVVLGILATIVFVSYNGISKKAQYTSIANTAKQHIRILGAYKVDNGNYPGWGSSSSLGYCMGEGYPNYDGDPAGDCINDADFTRFNYNENAALNTELKRYTNSLPVAQREGFVLDGHRYNGISYVFEPNTRIDGVWGPQGVIFYYLPGTKQDCQIPVLRYVGSGSNSGVGGNPSDWLFESNNPNKYSYDNGFATGCAYLLP